MLVPVLLFRFCAFSPGDIVSSVSAIVLKLSVDIEVLLPNCYPMSTRLILKPLMGELVSLELLCIISSLGLLAFFV